MNNGAPAVILLTLLSIMTAPHVSEFIIKPISLSTAALQPTDPKKSAVEDRFGLILSFCFTFPSSFQSLWCCPKTLEICTCFPFAQGLRYCRSNLNNYRPTILESLVNCQLMEFLIQNSVLSPHQSDFRSNFKLLLNASKTKFMFSSKR